MKYYQLQYETRANFAKNLTEIKAECESLSSAKAVFYLAWTENSRAFVKSAAQQIEEFFPDALYYGNEASGNIQNGNLVYGLTVCCYVLESEDADVKLVWVEEGTEFSSLDDLWTFCKGEEGLRAVELIPSIAYLDVLKIENSVPDISDDVLIFGGASVNYDNSDFGADIVAKGRDLTRQGMAVMLYYGRELHFSSAYILGWKGLGRHMRVTGSHDKVITEIDGVPAYSVYEKYLNLQDEDRDNLVFPLIVEEDGVEYIRTPQAFEADKSMRMFANIPEGSLARIAYGDKNTILQSLFEKLPEIEDFRPQGIKAYSCAARRLFWGNSEIKKETLPLQEIAPVHGFYTGGEILRFGNKLKVLNSTLVIISFREGEKTEAAEAGTKKHDVKADKSLVSKITYFAERIVEEQEEQQIQLARRTALSNYFLNSFATAYYCDMKTGVNVTLKQGQIPKVEEPPQDVAARNTYHLDCLVYPDDREITRVNFDFDYIRERLRADDEFSFNFREISGRTTYRCTVLRGDDEDHIAIGLVDVTDELREQKENEERLKNALDMADSANRAKTNFLFNMSHDIRTPMNAVIGFTQMAKKHIDDREKVLDCLEKIDESGDLLLSLINSVLDISRIESGNAVAERQPGDVYYSFVNFEGTLREIAKTKDIDLTFEFGNVEDRYVFCDFSRCSRVFVNVITNAIKYTPEGGSVKVRCEQIGREGDTGIYRYVISDNGIGMSEEFQKHVFEQFSRESTTMKSSVQGSGIGLAVTKSFVELMGGTIECESRQGEGTTFTVTLPFEIQNDEQYIDPKTKEIITIHAERHASVNLSGKRVLLCEDNELNREIAVDILEDVGLIVEEACNGAEGVKLVGEKGPDYYDFILMDIQMPEMNGYEATRIIRETYPDKRIPIIALSANAFSEDKAASLEAGMDDHVAKPIDIAKLFTAMTKLLK